VGVSWIYLADGAQLRAVVSGCVLQNERLAFRGGGGGGEVV
jgi:hypothetical protein